MAKGGSPMCSTSSAVICRDLWSPCSDCSSEENNSPTALNSFDWDKPALGDKALGFGWTSNQDNRNTAKDSSKSKNCDGDKKKNTKSLSNGYINVKSDNDERLLVTVKEDRNVKKLPEKVEESIQRCANCYSPLECDRLDSKSADDALNNDFSNSWMSSSDSFLMSPPTPTESKEDLIMKFQKEQERLKGLPWFQAGVPREIALQILYGKPEGSFVVRESTTKPGCYALSLRVPQSKNPSGIAHYLIMYTTKGYKIKGFTKEFSTLDALITHHSVMPELLPCPLSLSRHHQKDTRPEDDLEDLNDDKADRRSLFSNIHWLMNDLKL